MNAIRLADNHSLLAALIRKLNPPPPPHFNPTRDLVAQLNHAMPLKRKPKVQES